MEADAKSNADTSNNSGSTTDSTRHQHGWDDAPWGWPDLPQRRGRDDMEDKTTEGKIPEQKGSSSMWDEMIEFEQKQQYIGTDDGEGTINMDQDHPGAEEATFENFLDVVEENLIRSNVMLVSFIPDQLSHEDFLILMEAILIKLLGEQGGNATVLRFLRSPQGASYFSDQPPRWMELYHAEERHASFLLRLDQELTFGPMGAFGAPILPRVFQLSPLARNRNYLIQAVPPDFKTRFLRSPILAVWRGVGNSIHGGFPSTALCLASTYTSRVQGDRYDVDFFHTLSYHQSQATWGGTPIGMGHHPKPTGAGRSQRGRRGGRSGPPSPQQKPGKRVWMEFYILTLCSAPAGRHAELFGAYLPPEAHPRASVAVLNLFGWHCEVGRDLKPFRDGLGPDETLLTPLPVTVFPGIPRHTPLRELYRRLHSDGQDISSAKLDFFQQDAGTKTLYLSDGHTRYQATAALLEISSATTHESADLPGLASVRECYRLMRPANPPLQRTPTMHTPASLGRATARLTHPTYADVAGRPTQGLADTVTQISASRDPVLLQRASQLIVDHMRPLEQTLRRQQATIRELQQQVGDHATQINRAQATGSTALDLMVRQEAMITNLQTRAEEDRQRASTEQLRYQTELATAEAFRTDVRAALARLGHPMGPVPQLVPLPGRDPGPLPGPPTFRPIPTPSVRDGPPAPAAAARMDEG